jgi:magnesium transporter
MTASEPSHFDSEVPLPQLVDEVWRLPPEDAAVLLAGVPDAQVADLLRSLGPALADHLLQALDEDRRRAVLAAAPVEEGRQWARNQTYPDDTVGRLMDPPQPVFLPRLTVAEATAYIRELVKTTFVTYAFVVDESGRLVGVVTMRDLLLAADAARLETIMLRDPFALSPELPLVEAARQVVARHYPVYPVCDAEGRLVGTVRGRTLFQVQALEISAQAGAMVGVEKEERLATPWRRSLRFRHPWLQLNLFTAFLAAGVVGLFQGTINRLVVLAVFLPVLAGQSGNTGCQALAVTLRGLTLGELRPGRAAAGPEGGAARAPERRARGRDRGNRHVRGGPRTGRAARGDARPRGVRGDDGELRRQRPRGRAHPAHAAQPRRRPRHRVEHLPHDRHRRREHGALPHARDAARALTGLSAPAPRPA